MSSAVFHCLRHSATCRAISKSIFSLNISPSFTAFINWAGSLVSKLSCKTGKKHPPRSFKLSAFLNRPGILVARCTLLWIIPASYSHPAFPSSALPRCCSSLCMCRCCKLWQLCDIALQQSASCNESSPKLLGDNSNTSSGCEFCSRSSVSDNRWGQRAIVTRLLHEGRSSLFGLVAEPLRRKVTACERLIRPMLSWSSRPDLFKVFSAGVLAEEVSGIIQLGWLFEKRTTSGGASTNFTERRRCRFRFSRISSTYYTREISVPGLMWTKMASASEWRRYVRYRRHSYLSTHF